MLPNKQKKIHYEKEGITNDTTLRQEKAKILAPQVLESQNRREFRDHLIKHLEKAMAPHSSTLAWKTPWTEKPDGLQSMGSHRVGHD